MGRSSPFSPRNWLLNIYHHTLCNSHEYLHTPESRYLLFKQLGVYLFSAVLGSVAAWAFFLVVASRGYSPGVVQELLSMVAFLVKHWL